MKRRASPIASILAIVAFVFAQLAAAVYACEMGMAVAAAAAGQSNGDCCDPGHTSPDAGCRNHCQQASKASERPLASGVAPLAQASLAVPQHPDRIVRARPAAILRAPHLARHLEPPIFIRNCCFRI